MKTKKVITYLTSLELAQLEHLAEKQEVNMTDALRRALALAHFIHSEEEKGNTILVESDGITRKLICRIE